MNRLFVVFEFRYQFCQGKKKVVWFCEREKETERKNAKIPKIYPETPERVKNGPWLTSLFGFPVGTIPLIFWKSYEPDQRSIITCIVPSL